MVAVALLILWSCVSSPIAPSEDDTINNEINDKILGEFIQPVIQEADSQIDRAVEIIMSKMSLRRKIGQHLIGWIPRDGVSQEIENLVTSGLIGGFILYPWNYDSADEVRELTGKLNNLALSAEPEIGLFFAADQEGGRVAAFRFQNMAAMPGAYYLALYRDPKVIRSAAYITSVELLSLGVNMNLAPVLDLYAVPDRTIIGDRSMGADPEIVSALARGYIQGAREAGIIAVAKHFPGHGITAVDSHGSLPVVTTNAEVILRQHIAPFAAAIDEGVEAVMSAHVLYESIDEQFPATLSKIFVRDILRERLGFEGVVVSDGLAMGALSKNYTIEEVTLRCFKAGINQLLVHSTYEIEAIIEIIEEDVDEGNLTELEIEETLRPVLRLKLKHNIAGISEAVLVDE